MEFAEHQQKRLATLQPLVQATSFSKSVAVRAAASGLVMKHFVLSYKRSGEPAISRLMKEQVGGKKRVTVSRKIILAVAEHLAKNQQQPNCKERPVAQCFTCLCAP